MGDNLKHILVIQLAGYGAFHDNAAGGVDAALQSNRLSGKDIITGTHFYSDTSLLTIRNSLTNTRSQRVFDADNTDES